VKLYHGSNVEVANPEIIISSRNLDFGAGFYTTTDRNQAERWASIQAKRRKKGEAVLSVYDFNEENEDNYKIKKFNGPSAEWLEFVAQNRTGKYIGEKFDLVIGPVANDNTMPVIADFINGNIDEETALILLRPQQLKDQYAFLTQDGLSCLKFEGSERIG
jgi:hypothetical protein